LCIERIYSGNELTFLDALSRLLTVNLFNTKRRHLPMQPRHTRSSTVARPVAPPPRAVERPVEKPVEFVLHQPQAQSVALAGSFNGWDLKRTPLRKDSAGNWKTTLWLPPGRYEYRFVVDASQWVSDPNAKESAGNQFGSSNSIIAV
jgi:1,4-alpha-glucan branching enzyme